ncbi:uncharacterized protein KY384_000576 [Bacidia gigantensis]|uniref:uncharacterized protein n=1 Tax=Bacidia gigantensis TaxID=2732470 RepID=UPI001D058244|nr:uncharacterized protein KY384_000576 [Bacidia gigantensis]KAG8525816.1 hypothetical protein KY384_000576 [Bacidia gigantensis]
MYGTLLDQRVFESLVERTMPILWDHLVKSDVQLSVVSLPWFLSLYINSMPLVFAFRVLDVFFLEGPKVLFQVGLAILRINGEELLDIIDDGSFISILKTYFSRLDESAHPKSENEKVRNITKFQELMVVAFKEFAGITQSTISEQRMKYRDSVLDNIESFAKRTSIRNLGPESKKLSLGDLGFLYDRFYSILYEREQRMQQMRDESERKAKAGSVKATELVTGLPGNKSFEIGRVGLGPSPTLMNYDGFREFLAGITKWAITDSPSTTIKELEREGSIYSNYSGRSRSISVSPWGNGPEPADHDFMQRLYGRWNRDDNDGLSLQDVVTGIAHVKGTRDIMTSISYFFDLYDDDKDGKVDREGILRISEALLFLSRRGLGGSPTPSTPSQGYGFDEDLDPKSASTNERFLGSVSAFIRRCFEYADPDHPNNQEGSAASEPNMESFSIGDSESDDEEDLLDLGNEQAKSTPPKASPTIPTNPPNHPTRTASIHCPTHAANVALDPTRPLHITLPTFRMVILADELLQQFFESSFPASFYLTNAPTPSSPSITQLTTFASSTSSSVVSNVVGPRAGGVVPPSKGLRGVLDNIVQDGMRVATEVRRRVDDVGREIERSALQRENEMDEEEHEQEQGGLAGADSDRKSIREGDRDLLEGAEAIAGSVGGAGSGHGPGGKREQDLLGDLEGKEGEGKEMPGLVEFER